MDIQPTEEQKAIADALHDFAKNEIRPAARECEEAGQVSERIEKQLFEMGVAAPIPEEFGGQGTFDAVTSVIISEEIAWGDPGVAFSVLGGGLPATLVDLIGDKQQKEELLPKIVDGARAYLALSERDAGADFTEVESSVSGEGTGARVSGTKYAVVHADTAAVRLVVARDSTGPSVWIVPQTAEVQLKPEDKLGLRSARTFKLTLEDVDAVLLGGPDSDRATTQSALLRAKLLNAGVALGLSRAAIEYATTYAQERTAFGRPIGAFQAIAFKIADRAMDYETARLLVWKAAWALDQNRPDAERFVMSACSQAIVAAVASGDDGVQILGGHGYMRDHPEELWYRDAMTLAALDSPSLVGDLFLAKSYKVGE